MKKVLFIASHRKDRAPGQRFRFEQYFDFLEANGYQCHLSYIINENDDKVLYSPGRYLHKIFIAAKAGANIISPFIGRLDDISQDGMYLIEQIVQIYGNYGYETEILVASIRHPMHFVDSCLVGADICTMPFKVIEQLVKHPLTDSGLEKFLSDWKKLNG